MTDWETAGKRHEIEGGGHWHEPNYPSCVVCRMRDLEASIAHTELLARNVDEIRVHQIEKLQERIAQLECDLPDEHPIRCNCPIVLGEADAVKLREIMKGT